MNIRARWKTIVILGTRLALAMLALAVPLEAFAQNGPPIPKWYLSKGALQIPIHLDEKTRSQVQEVLLFVKDGPQAPWKLKDKVPGTQQFFTFRAAEEGEFGLNLATVDRSGRMSPSDMTNEPVRLMVIVDTTAPQADVQFLSTNLEGTCVRCAVKDPHLDPSKTRIFYQTREQQWRPLNPTSGQPDVYSIPYTERLTGMIRVFASDLAGNTLAREVNLATAAVANDLPTLPQLPVVAAAPSIAPAAPSITPAAPSIATAAPEIPLESILEPLPPLPPLPKVETAAAGVISEQIIPFNERIELVANKPRPTPMPPDARDQAPPTSVKYAAASSLRIMPNANDKPVVAAQPPEKRHYVNNSRVFLDYQIEQAGDSGVGRVDIWYTKDLCLTWQKLGEDAERKGHASIDLPGDGTYGVTVVAANGRGLGAEPPKPGDLPDWWVEVDTTKPSVELLQAIGDTKAEHLAVDIKWSARDKNLHAEPVDILYANTLEGPWLPIAKGQKSEGAHRWHPPLEAGAQVYIRISARDRAGNTGSVESANAVQLDDLSRPRVRLVGVTTSPKVIPGKVATPSGN